MHGDNMLESISERLNNLTIHEVRQVAREVKAHVTSGQKGQIIEAVLSIARAEVEPAPATNRGAPPKSDKYDERLVSDIFACREYLIAQREGDGKPNKTAVTDGEYDFIVSSDKEYSGFLDRQENVYYLYGEERVYVSDLLVERHALRIGDKITGRGRKNHPSDVAGLYLINSVNGLSAEVKTERKDFSSFTRIYPEKRIKIDDGSDVALKILDLFSPVALGQRAFISAPSNCGKTSLLKSIAHGICANYEGLEVIILLIGARPEEITDFKRIRGLNQLFYTTFDMSEECHLTTATVAFNYAKRLAELNKNAVVLADGLYDNLPYEELKKLLYCALNAEEGASITTIATLPEEASALLKTSNMTVTLSPVLASERVFPAIDILKCYSAREEVLLTQEEKETSLLIRSKLAEGYPLAKLINIFKQTDNALKVAEIIKNG